jgi:hypothetical protein
MMTHNCSALRISPTMLLCQQIAVYQAAHSRRNATTTLLLLLQLEFLPMHPSRRKGDTCVDVTMSRQEEFLSTLKKPQPWMTLALHPFCHQLAHATTVLQSPQSSPSGQCCEFGKREKKDNRQGTTGREQPHHRRQYLTGCSNRDKSGP